MDKLNKIRECRSKGYNCAQALLCSYAYECGISEKHAFKLTSGLGLGLGSKHLCGALNAMSIILGSLVSNDIDDISNKQEVYQKVSEQVKRFELENGSLLCEDLKSKDQVVSCDELIRLCSSYIDEFMANRMLKF